MPGAVQLRTGNKVERKITYPQLPGIPPSLVQH